MSYSLLTKKDGLALSGLVSTYGIGALVAVLAAEADGRGDYGTAKALRGAGVTFCGMDDDFSDFAPECKGHLSLANCPTCSPVKDPMIGCGPHGVAGL